MDIRESVINSEDCKIVEVQTPEWGVNVCVKQFDVKTRSAIVELQEEDLPDSEFLTRCATIVICDEHGDRVFTNDDACLLESKNPAVIERVCEEAFKVNGMGADEIDKEEEK